MNRIEPIAYVWYLQTIICAALCIAGAVTLAHGAARVVLVVAAVAWIKLGISAIVPNEEEAR